MKNILIHEVLLRFSTCIHRSRTFVLASFAALLISATPERVDAQLSIDSLGTDTSQNESYQCVRFTDSSQNSVSVTDQNNQETSLSVSAARQRVKKSLRRSNVRIKRLSSQLKRTQQKLKSIRTKILPRPSTSKQIKKLKKQISRTKKALNVVRGQKRNLNNLGKAVAKCGEDAPLVGGLISRTITFPSLLFDGRYTGYNIGIFFNVTRNVKAGEQFCLGSSNFFRGVRLASVIIDPCPVRDSDFNCTAQHSGVRGFGISGITGTDFPGACAPGDELFRCNFGAANEKAAELLAQYGDVRVLGKADTTTRCERFER